MKALASIKQDTLDITFPDLAPLMRDRITRHLEKLARSNHGEQGQFTPGQIDAAIRRIAREHTVTPSVSVHFQRTLRIPDDDKTYPLPPGLGRFPLRHVDDLGTRVPESWRERGGILFPMHQSEALWMQFHSTYPIALKVAAGKICAVSGEAWADGLSGNPQNYCLLPEQPWLDGYAIEKGVIRQFVAQPLGAGFTVEEQLTGKPEWGGIQIQALPLDPALAWRESIREEIEEAWHDWANPTCENEIARAERGASMCQCFDAEIACKSVEPMGLAAGGRMKQEIYEDRRDPADYLAMDGNRCFVHLCNSQQWELLTGEAPPHQPPSARTYSRHGLPWFDYYDEKQMTLPGGEKLKDIKSVKELQDETGQQVLPAEPDEAKPKVIVKYIKE